MTTFKKLLAVGAAAGSLFAMVGSADALVSATSGTPFIASATAPASITLTGNTFVLDTTDIPGGAGGPGTFVTAFRDGSVFTFTLSSGTFASAPVIGVTGGPLPTLTGGGAGSNFVTYTLATGTTTTSLTLSNLVVNSPAAGSSTAPLTVTVTSPQAILSNVPAAQRVASIATYSAPFSFGVASGTAPTQVAVNATTGRIAAGATALAALTGTYTATRLYDGVTATTLGAATASLAFANYTAGEIASVDFAGCVANAGVAPANPTVSTGAAAIVASCTITPTLNGSAVASAAGLGPLTLTGSLTVTNGPAGATAVSGSGVVGTVIPAAGAVSTFLSYVVGSDTAYGYYIGVATTSSSGAVRAYLGPYSATIATSQARDTSTVYDVQNIRAALIATGAPSNILQTAGDRASLTITSPASSRVTGMLLAKSQNIVTQTGLAHGATP